MRIIKENLGEIVICILELLVGIILFVDPVRFTTAILMWVGALLVAAGVICLIRYFRTEAALAALEHTLSIGVVMALLGVFLLLRTEWVIGLFPFLTNVYGVIILVIGVVKLQHGVDLLRLHLRYWYLPLIAALLAVLFALVILAYPFASTVVLWRFAAVSLVVEAVLDIVALLVCRQDPRERDGV